MSVKQIETNNNKQLSHVQIFSKKRKINLTVKPKFNLRQIPIDIRFLLS